MEREIKIDVEDLAGFMLERLHSDQWIRKTPLAASGEWIHLQMEFSDLLDRELA